MASIGAINSNLQQGLKQNWSQFTLLVIINAFVGGMVGLERSVLPTLAESSFNISAHTAILSFIIVFGLTKAFSNLFMGSFANKIGRKKLLIIGWLFGIPIPFLLIYAPSWSWILIANGFLGINQGLCWSSTVIMKIDLVGDKNRGLAMGINESAGYISVGIFAFLSSWLAIEYGMIEVSFYPAYFLLFLGIVSSVFLVKDTVKFVASETKKAILQPLKNLFLQTTWKNKNLGSITQAGLVNNLNDGMMWGLLPVFLASKGFALTEIGQIVAIYPIVWGLGQLFTGRMADIYSKKKMLWIGMLLQALTIIALIFVTSKIEFTVLFVLLGLGTAIVYPTFLAAISDFSHPDQRAGSLGVFRFWRDFGYVIGAVLTGVIADVLGINYSIVIIGLITFLSSLIIKVRMSSKPVII